MKFGVIGGNGVAATNLLCHMIEHKITASGAYRDAHHPEMIVWQATNVPSRSMFLEGRGPDWRPDYMRIAKNLKSLGCDMGCMCCNTAHYAIDAIVKSSGLPFINLLEEVAFSAVGTGLRRFELFCSDGARKFDIYRSAFDRVCPDVEIVYPSEDRQRIVTQVICNVKNKARMEFKIDDVRSPAALLHELVKTAVAPVILGCTDLRVASPELFGKGEYIAVDSLECLANKIVEMHLGSCGNAF